MVKTRGSGDGTQQEDAGDDPNSDHSSLFVSTKVSLARCFFRSLFLPNCGYLNM